MPIRRLGRTLKQFKAALREPLPDTARLGRGARWRARLAHLNRRHGWKVLAAIAVYYLVRDTVLYLIAPYLIARQLLP